MRSPRYMLGETYGPRIPAAQRERREGIEPRVTEVKPGGLLEMPQDREGHIPLCLQAAQLSAGGL